MKCVRLFAIALSLGAAANVAHADERAVNNAIQCQLIRNAAQLQAMHANGTYCLANDIDTSSIANFVPIGDFTTPFSGRLYGNGYSVRNLTISNSTANAVLGLFGFAYQATIQDLGLVNVKITGTGSTSEAGALAGDIAGSAVARVHSTGQITCTQSCFTGGLIGEVNSAVSPQTIDHSWSAVNVIGSNFEGGLFGFVITGNTITRSYATGSVTCVNATNCSGTGGLAGGLEGDVSDSFATGPVTATTANASAVGGFVGLNNNGTITRSFATGRVRSSSVGILGSLVGNEFNGSVTDSYGTGNVTGGAGATLGGLIGSATGGPVITDSYWDTVTTGQSSSAGGTGKSTTQLRAALQSGFDANAWGITKNLSYPYLQQAATFAAPLATQVSGIDIFTYVPISQLDMSQYRGNPHHTDAASLATVYTMIARAVGFGANVAQLANVKIDKYFWHDVHQNTTFTGPITLHATLGSLTTIVPAAHMNNTNVIGQISVRRLVILRGTYSKVGGGTGTHWMLATMYTKAGAFAQTIVANDPWTGAQVEIDPVSKKVISPRNFPLANFTVNGYQAVTVN
ncbi:MAG: GLUG motif-containing protein [Pseudolabrys sp.]